MRVIGALVLGLGGAAILVALGLWQVQRLAWKEEVLARIEARVGGPAAEALPARPDPDRDQYLPVKLRGRLCCGTLRVLDSRRRVGPGYRLVTGLETGDRRVLLDRGFVPIDAEIAEPAAGEITVVGNLLWPDDRTGATPQNDIAGNIWFARDLEDMAAALDAEPVLVVAREPTGDGIEPLAVSPENIPNNHLQYAITWFSLAVAWLGMTGYLLWRIKRRTA